MRNITNFNNGWMFSRDLESTEKHPVTLPHTWNAEDGQDGGNDYYRGTCFYEKQFTVSETDSRELWLEFEGAAMSCEVFLNGESLGRHEGGYSTFRFCLNGHLKAENSLLVSVDNSDNSTVYPQSADFTFYGGLYRDVHLIEVPEIHFALGYCGGSGLKVTPVVDGNKATVTAEAWLENGDAEVTFETVGQSMTVSSENGYAKTEFIIENVHLWDGVDDPYLYEMKAYTSDDEVETKYGCRTYTIDAQKGFFLNGRSYPLRGVSRHQDRKGAGNAISKEMHEEDMAIIREIGANSIRLAHYQHSGYFYDLCDRYGIIVWAEIPYITKHMNQGKNNTLSQMKELIIQCYNHPSIAVWGLSNEITAASIVNDDLLENHRELNDLCHRLDPTRLTTMANVFMLETDSQILDIPDVNSYNLYFGWYVGEMEQTDEFFDEFHEKYPDRAIGFSEYGADANPRFHSSAPDKGDYTEEYQALYHEHMLDMIEARPYLWSTYVWNMFDFAADGRDEGGEHGLNQKGLVTFDRTVRKDTFYLYKAAWNKAEPFVHLCGRRYVNRTEDQTEVKVYSNQTEIALYVDGKLFAKETGKHVFRFSVPLTGEHEITAEANGCSDTMILRKVSQPEESYIFNKAAASVANWFDTAEIDPTCFSVQDTLGELRSHPQAGAVINAMMANAAAQRGDVADAVKDNPALQKMLARMTMISMLKQAGADQESILQLNRILQGIKK